ncbi:MAG: phytanoyl-CoA dioxygenase family protein [Candidatus Latescibacteria bacterium]|nr:phytanoyl-CoA dioxygenase family protein [Candidatus Latescibacterota bacterium]
MLDLARWALGPTIRFDHCVNLSRPAGNHGAGWHSHPYAEDRPELGHLRIFFYTNGFSADDGGLRVVPGSHHYREGALSFTADEEFQAGWLGDKRHPATGQPLTMLTLDAPAGTVALMWTHAAHAVTPKRTDSAMRWAIVYAYRNPGAPSSSRFITEAFKRHPPAGTDSLMSPD